MILMDSCPQTTYISVEIVADRANIFLNRPDKFNALNVEMIEELITIFEWTKQRSAGYQDALCDANGQPFLRTLVLRGHGKHFCAGADINMMRDAGSNTQEENRADAQRLDRLFNGLWSHPCFTITAAQGVALGGGAGLVACSDFVIAAPQLKIALSEGKLGILPAVIGPYVYRRLGSATFRRLAMQASRIATEEALRIGFIENIAEENQFDERIEGVINEILTTGPCAVTQAKVLSLGFDRWTQTDEELRLWTLDFTSKMRGSNEGQEGLSSFLEKRPPQWSPDLGKKVQ